ncbi:hypothetical protein [Sphingomonas sp. BK580]|uniref:hypothetical protein n=1 Tax=Sphingomonas sp. BK580 TaxID=2586972 RepID=UPI00161E7C43|nr:hypothetical protein [Sphingomonas sp. BK580]MBB3693048.1 hypothetical protein [Sphingomonas sp. BK580]
MNDIDKDAADFVASLGSQPDSSAAAPSYEQVSKRLLEKYSFLVHMIQATSRALGERFGPNSMALLVEDRSYYDNLNAPLLNYKLEMYLNGNPVGVVPVMFEDETVTIGHHRLFSHDETNQKLAFQQEIANHYR